MASEGKHVCVAEADRQTRVGLQDEVKERGKGGSELDGAFYTLHQRESAKRGDPPEATRLGRRLFTCCAGWREARVG